MKMGTFETLIGSLSKPYSELSKFLSPNGALEGGGGLSWTRGGIRQKVMYYFNSKVFNNGEFQNKFILVFGTSKTPARHSRGGGGYEARVEGIPTYRLKM